MAEQKSKKKEDDPKAETARVILAGIDLPIKQVAQAMAKQLGWTEEKAEKELAKAGDGKTVTAWLDIGRETNGNKKKAIEQKVGKHQHGKFRAPGAAAWAGGIAKKIPAQIILEVESLD